MKLTVSWAQLKAENMYFSTLVLLSRVYVLLNPKYLPPKSKGYFFRTPCTPPLVFTGSMCSMNMTRISSLVLTAPRFVFWRLKGIVRGVLRVKWLSIKQWFVSGDMISDWAVHTPFIYNTSIFDTTQIWATSECSQIVSKYMWRELNHKGQCQC